MAKKKITTTTVEVEFDEVDETNEASDASSDAFADDVAEELDRAFTDILAEFDRMTHKILKRRARG